MGLQRLLLQPTQPNPESLAENVPWPVTEFEAFFLELTVIHVEFQVPLQIQFLTNVPQPHRRHPYH